MAAKEYNGPTGHWVRAFGVGTRDALREMVTAGEIAAGNADLRNRRELADWYASLLRALPEDLFVIDSRGPEWDDLADRWLTRR